MRNWKNWLFPLLTALTVAALALLPLRLSILEDGKLNGAVHAEPLAEDSNFPFKPPELPGRIWLLVQWQELPENLTVMAQELEGGDRDREMERLRAALADLGDLLSPDAKARLTAVDGSSWDWSRCYLRDQTDLSSAGFTLASTYDKERHASLSATLDGETGQLLGLVFHHIDGVPCDASARELGAALLDRLGLDYVPQETVGSAACFRLPDCKSLFWIVRDSQQLAFNFTVDWAAVDRDIAVSYGREPTDADLMQKR